MSYYPDYFLSDHSADDNAILHEWLMRQQQAARQAPALYTLAAGQLGYGPMPHCPSRGRNQYYPRLQAPLLHDNSSVYGGPTSLLDVNELPAPIRPWPSPPPRPPPRPVPPPSGPRPQPYPRPPFGHIPGPKRQHGRQTSTTDYYPRSSSTDVNYQNEMKGSQFQPKVSQYRSAKGEDSEGSRTPTQRDYMVRDFGYQSQTSTTQATPAQSTSGHAPASKPTARNEHRPPDAQPKTHPESPMRPGPQGLSRRQRRAFRSMLPDELTERGVSGSTGLRRDPLTDRLQTSSHNTPAATPRGMTANSGTEGDLQGGAYDLQVPRSPN